jgi:colanic acid/amylovoran biosynthesis glycosyltransferase
MRTSPMKVAYLINQYPKVSHSFIRREIRELEAQGVAIARFSLRSSGEVLVDPGDRSEAEQTQVVLGQSPVRLLGAVLGVLLRRPWPWLQTLAKAAQLSRSADRGLVYHLAYFVEACQVWLWCRAQALDHIHAHFGTNSTTVALLCQHLGGLTYSFTAHGPEEFDRGVVLNLPEKIKQAQFVVAISSYGRSQLYRQCPYEDWAKIKVVHCGLERSFLPSELTPPPETRQLICVGRLCEQKGQTLLIEAIATLVRQGHAVHLVLVGDGPMRTELESLIYTHNLGDFITLKGWASSDEVKQLILDSRALVLPSFAEGLPVVLMEALGLGRPVVSTYVAGIPELVNSSDSSGVKGQGNRQSSRQPNGWLVPAGSVEALADALVEVLEMPVMNLARMGVAGAQAVARQHSIEQEVKQLAVLFQTRGGLDLPRPATALVAPFSSLVS